MKHKWLGDLDSCSHVVRFKGNWTIIVFKASGTCFHIKVDNMGNLQDEFDALVQAYRKLPQNVPKPLALEHHGGYRFLITQGCPHQRIHAKSFAQNPWVYHALYDFFKRQLWSFQTPQKVHILPWEQLSRDFDCTWAPEIIDRIHQGLETLPTILQHGDFAMNNLGIYKRQLWVFDWEDFAKVTLPILDLVIFIWSFYQRHLKETIRALKKTTDPLLDRFIEKVCSLYQISRSQLQRLAPFAFYQFYRLKVDNQYAPEVIHTCQQATLNSILALWTPAKLGISVCAT